MIDDQATYTEGLALAFGMQSDLEVVGRATSSVQGVDIALKIQPDLVLCDYRIPGEANGVECAARLRENGYDGEIVILTGFAAPHIHDEAKALANVKVLSKDLSVIDLVENLTQPRPAAPTTGNRQQPVRPTLPAQPKPRRVLLVAVLLTALAAALAFAAIFQPTNQQTQIGLERPFVIIDGTEPTRVSITIGDSPTNTFTPANLPATIAINPTTDTTITVTIANTTNTSSCAIGTNHHIQITQTKNQTTTTCTGTLQ